jgi:MipA family protein
MNAICTVAAAAALVSTLASHAGEPPDPAKAAGDEPPPFAVRGSAWSAGVGAFYSTEPYEGVDGKVRAFPTLIYFGERLAVTGPRASYRVARWKGFTCRAVMNYDFSGYEEDDSDALRGMDDRDGTLEAGMSLSRKLPAKIEIAGALGTDVLGTHDGQKGRLELQRNEQWGKCRLGVGVGVTWLSDSTADYYYGVRPEEEAPGRPPYDVDDAFNPGIEFRITYFPTERLTIMAMPRIELLDRGIRDSPIVGEDALFACILGISYGL